MRGSACWVTRASRRRRYRVAGGRKRREKAVQACERRRRWSSAGSRSETRSVGRLRQTPSDFSAWSASPGVGIEAAAGRAKGSFPAGKDGRGSSRCRGSAPCLSTPACRPIRQLPAKLRRLGEQPVRRGVAAHGAAEAAVVQDSTPSPGSSRERRALGFRGRGRRTRWKRRTEPELRWMGRDASDDGRCALCRKPGPVGSGRRSWEPGTGRRGALQNRSGRRLPPRSGAGGWRRGPDGSRLADRRVSGSAPYNHSAVLPPVSGPLARSALPLEPPHATVSRVFRPESRISL